MSLTSSTMLALGSAAPDFSLPHVVTGNKVSLKDLEATKGLLVIFLCVHCPYVVHVRKELAQLGNQYKKLGFGVVAISSNDVENYPEDRPDQLKAMAIDFGFTFPLLFDATQETAKAYTAACTPDFFLFDASKKLVYRGQLDDSRPGSGKPVTGKDLRAALDALIDGNSVNADQRPATGCNIKWKAGNEPSYY